MKFLSIARRGVVACLMASTCAVWAADDYPNKPIRLIGTFAAGSSVDILSRIVGKQMSDLLGQPILVEPRPGAGGDIATDIVAKAPKDGYTLGIASPGPLTINPLLRRQMPYEALRDLAPISLIAKGPNALFVNAQLPVRDLAELIKYIQAHPGKVSFASAGVGTTGHLAGELFKSKTGTDIQHVAYKGQNEAVTDVVGGRVDLIFSGLPPLLALVKTGKLRPIAVADFKRSPVLPDVPTTAEAGISSIESVAWYGLMAPAGTPDFILERLRLTLGKALQQPETLAQLATLGVVPAPSSRAEFSSMLNDETRRWKVLLDASGIKPE